jgi:molybdenum cofactor cytidylyltransferase
LESSEKKSAFISGILLASGASRRMKPIKQLLDWNGKYLINHIIDEILKSKIDALYVILGSNFEEIHKNLDQRTTVIQNKIWKQGKSSSIKRGVKIAKKNSEGIIFFLVDQPFINRLIINTLIDNFKKTKKNIIVPRVNGQECNPVLFGKKYFNDLLKLTGEKGGKDIFNSADDVLWINWEDKRLLLDIDTEMDYKNLLENYSSFS